MHERTQSGVRPLPSRSPCQLTVTTRPPVAPHAASRMPAAMSVPVAHSRILRSLCVWLVCPLQATCEVTWLNDKVHLARQREADIPHLLSHVHAHGADEPGEGLPVSGVEGSRCPALVL